MELFIEKSVQSFLGLINLTCQRLLVMLYRASQSPTNEEILTRLDTIQDVLSVSRVQEPGNKWNKHSNDWEYSPIFCSYSLIPFLCFCLSLKGVYSAGKLKQEHNESSLTTEICVEFPFEIMNNAWYNTSSLIFLSNFTRCKHLLARSSEISSIWLPFNVKGNTFIKIIPKM